MKLSQPARLRTLMAKHRADVEILLRQRVGGAVVFDEGANGSGCAFRSKRERRAISIRKGVHFFFDDVRRRTDTASEERRYFEDGNSDLTEPIHIRPPACDLLDELPPRCI